MLPIHLVSVAALLLAVSSFADFDSTASSDVARRQYGPAYKVGNGTARAYVVLDEDDDRAPLEIGVALSESAMEGLPTSVPATHGEHAAMPAMSNTHILQLPVTIPAPYHSVQFNWNPSGQEPDGIYDQPHFDFVFWRIADSVRTAIVPANPQYAENSGDYPAAELRPPFYADAASLMKAPAAVANVPLTGMYWLDIRSPELQAATGNPKDYEAFAKTYVYGTWDGEFVFDEPMITRAYLMSKRTATDQALRDEVIPVPTQPHYAKPGYYPTAYRIAYDAKAKEYRVALTQLVQR